MIDDRYTIAEVSDMLETSKSSVRKIAAAVPGAKKLPNKSKVDTWTFSSDSISTIAEILHLDIEAEKGTPAKEDKGGEEEGNFQRNPVDKKSSGNHAGRILKTGEIDIWTILAIVGVLIVMVFSFSKR